MLSPFRARLLVVGRSCVVRDGLLLGSQRSLWHNDLLLRSTACKALLALRDGAVSLRRISRKWEALRDGLYCLVRGTSFLIREGTIYRERDREKRLAHRDKCQQMLTGHFRWKTWASLL